MTVDDWGAAAQLATPSVQMVFGTFTGTGGGILAENSFGIQTLYVVRGIDCTMPNYDNGSNAAFYYTVPGGGGGEYIFFQAFVYTSSQAAFSWRGALPLAYQRQVSIDAVIGTWNAVCWGTIEPNPDYGP